MAETTQNIIRPQAGFQEKFVRSNIDFVVGGGVLNCGKAQPLDSLVLTPNGWIKMGDLKAGDIICDTKGGTQRVEEVFERGILPCKKVYFDDNSTVECCEEHLWTVWNKREKTYETIELKEISKDLSNYTVDLVSPVSFNNSYKKIIHPYLLGVLLSVALFGKTKDIIERANTLNYFDDIWHSYKKTVPCATITGTSILNELKRLGLIDKLPNEIFIPREYLYSSIEDRVDLLRGIFDTAGCNDKDTPYVEYLTISKQIATDVVFLVRSLGGKARVSTKINSDKVEYSLSCVIFKGNHFTLSRGKDNSEHRENISLSFEKIEDCGAKEMRCILVSHPNHLYITNNFVATHNTFAAVLSIADASTDPNFRAVFLRNNLNDLKGGGGILDTFRDVYGNGVSIVESGDPSATFPSGAKVDITHVADQSREKVLQRFKGRQYDYIYFDEGTGFTWSCFTTIFSRNRGRAKWTGKVRMTTNPERNHWLRTFLDWYIGIDGFIMPEREGVVRYFYINGETVKDVVWGDSKEEVYSKCKIQIDRVLAKVNGNIGTATYKDVIKSFTFYLGKMSENKASIGNNSGYVGSVAITGGRNAQQLLEGNWNVSPNEDLNAPIPSEMANQVFINDEQRNGDKWVTCDLADTGTDNFLCLAWDGFHIFDILILGQTTPRENAERLEMFAAIHGISNSHIIYDAIRGTYINDYIPDAIPFFSFKTPIGMYSRMAYNLKTECYMRLAEAIKRQYISFSETIANKTYEHRNMKHTISIQNEFLEECSVVRFKDMPNGRKALLSKKEMNSHLGKGRSMDLLDPCAMRFYPCLEYPYGEELEKTMGEIDVEYDEVVFGKQSIYDESFWC